VGRCAQVYQLMEVGAAARMTGATKLNERSSRSHAVFILIVEQARGPGGGAAGDEMDQFRGLTPGARPYSMRCARHCPGQCSACQDRELWDCEASRPVYASG
jgi:hypothetical protein